LSASCASTRWIHNARDSGLFSEKERNEMSWIASAVGKPAAVAASIASQIGAYKCIEPEEGVKQAVGAALAASLAAQNPDSVVKVIASGHQTGPTDGLKNINNTVHVEVEPIHGFVE
jgi:hypothetical protein